ncbi:MAG: GNAT family N-acetyltransferase [Clostridia bacterium]|nr:GNAT family N-acetyltransferase [Clostridia bacterium]
MAIIRSMSNDDLLAYQQLCSICYTYRATEAPQSLPEEKLRIRMGAFGEDGRLLSAMMQIPYDVRFEGETVKLLGIGGVVTDPCARREGAVRRLFEEGLPRLYAEGYVFSALYPFSHRFYRKFGYETAEFWRSAELPRASLRADLKAADEIVRVLPDGDGGGMGAVYAEYAADKHLAVLRDEAMWADLRRGTPWADLKYAYVMKKAGRPVAYWIGTMKKEGWHTTLTLQDFAWNCPEGLEAIFAMIRGMNEVEYVVLRVQGGFDPRVLVEEPYDVTWRGPCDGMLRVMNVERALVLLPAPPLPGTLHIRVTDEQIPQNNGTFALNCDGYGLSVTREEDAAADMMCDIRGLAVLMSGQRAFGECVSMGAAALLNEKKRRLAEILFGRRMLHMNHNF